MARAIEACVHCGFCLAACPTYRELGQEMDSPRGRIVLMKEVLEGHLPWSAAQLHIDRCLGCLACEPACPSGVAYRDLVSPFRALGERRFVRSAGSRLRDFLSQQILPYPARFRVAIQLSRLAKPFESLLPGTLRPMLDLIPPNIPPRARWPALIPAQGPRRARAALLLGCAQQVLAPEINTATIAVLTRNGIEVIVPPDQACCGGLAWHSGRWAEAQASARRNLRAFSKDVDVILTNAAGCGSTMHEYHLVLRGTPDEPEAQRLAARVMDVTWFLGQLGLANAPVGFKRPVRIAYHDACHLSNGQGVRAEPRALLASVPGVQLCELSGADLCCGSAGTYNLEQPAIASRLGEQKAKAVIATGADLVATGNIGCQVQLRTHLARLGSPVRVQHTMQILHQAYQP
jgi:glycolate oxidase iron-sulfur subunit